MPWYAIASKPQRELALVDALADAGFPDAFTPVAYRWSRERRGTKRTRRAIPVPLFVGYTFANFDRIPWSVLRTNRELVRGVVSMNGMPIAIPAHQILSARAIEASAQPYHWAADTRAKLLPVPGQTVEIVAGPLTGTFTKVEAVTVSHVVALGNMLGGARLHFPHDHVRAA